MKPHTSTFFLTLSNFNPLCLVWEENSTNQTRKGCAIYMGKKFAAHANNPTGTPEELNSLIEFDLAYVCDLLHATKRCTAYYQGWHATGAASI